MFNSIKRLDKNSLVFFIKKIHFSGHGSVPKCLCGMHEVPSWIPILQKLKSPSLGTLA